MSATQKDMGHVYAIFTILVWGSCFVLTKQMRTAYTAIQINPLRMGLAFITLCALRPKTLKLPWRDELMFILIGVTGGSFYFFLQNTALTYTFAANVSIIIALSPILTVILAQLFSRNGERLGKFVYIGAVIAITGAIDIVADGKKAYCIRNGHPMMSSITGTGCQLSAMTAAYVTANPEHPLEAAAAAVCAMGLAGEIGCSRMAEGDGNSTYRNRIIDAIYNMDGATLNGGAKYELR